MNKQTNSEYVMKSQRRKKIYAIEQFGGKCQICGYNKCINALEFHHIDKEEKEEPPSYIIMRWSWERVKKELEKCILVCANCHREIHYDENRNISLDTYIMPWVEKECKVCKKTFSTKRIENQYCSNVCRGYDDRKTKWPTKEELQNLIVSTSWVQIGKMFNVSDNAVRKWARKYNLI